MRTIVTRITLSIVASTILLPMTALSTEDPSLQTMAAGYYSQKYRVPLDEAQRRLAIQDQTAGIEDDLAGLLGADFAGVWYDAASYGRLKIGITDAGRRQVGSVQEIISRYAAADYTDLVHVRYSVADLERIQESIHGDMAAMLRMGHAQSSYNTKTNQVTVTAMMRLPASEEADLRRISAVAGVSVVRANVPTLFDTFDSCLVTKCDPPFRGGRQLSSSGFCTSAFSAHYPTAPNVPLVMTAGHCIWAVGLATVWQATTEAAGPFDLGAGDGYVFSGSYGEDEGVIRVASGGFWSSPPPIAAVVVKGDQAGYTAYNPSYAITTDAYSSIGKLLCRTGRTTGTECGEVTSLGVTFSAGILGSTFEIRNAGEIDVCGAQGGDSGGPLYKSQRAYGIFLSTQNVGPAFCHERYQGIRGAERTLNVSIDTQ